MAPKRPADAYTTNSFPTDRSTTSTSGKRTRYAPPNASTVLGEPHADDLELDLEGTGGTQNANRNKVVTDGYDSDSSGGEDEEGGFGGAGGGRRVAKGKGQQGDEGAAEGKPTMMGNDDDEDMFGPAGGDREMEGLGSKGKEKEKNKAEKEWLEMGDIEGQEFNRRDDDDEEGGDDDEELDDEEEYEPVDDHANDDDAPRSRRSKKGMGFELSSFNMKEELAEGRFSADGSYVANAIDPLANHDSWLTGLSKSQIKAAREAKERMDAKNREREQEEASKGEEQLTQLRDDCLIGLLGNVRPGETVAGALNRLGRAKKRAEALASSSSTENDASGEGSMEVDQTSSNQSSISRYTTKINRLTHFASTLLSSHGELEIYDQRYEDIIKTLKAEGAVRRDWTPPEDSVEDREKEEREEREWKERERLEKERIKGSSSTGAGGSQQHREGRSKVLVSRPTGPTTTSTATPDKFYYKWNPPAEGQSQEEYGPFERKDLESWIQQGYFGDMEASRILIKKEGGTGQYGRWNQVK